MILYIVRHPETVDNSLGICEGQQDSGYSEQGFIQFENLVKELLSREQDYDTVITSPLARARNVAKVVSAGLGKIMLERSELMERNFGIFQGLLSDESVKNQLGHNDDNWQPQDGESRNSHRQRVACLFRECISMLEEHNLLFVTHAGTIVRFLEIVGLEYFKPANASISTFEYENGVWRAIKINDVDHLDCCVRKGLR